MGGWVVGLEHEDMKSKSECSLKHYINCYPRENLERIFVLEIV